MDWEGERAPKINAIWMLERNKNPLKIWLFFKSKSKKIVKEHASKNPFFEVALFNLFWEGLGRVWGGFWEGFGGSWPLLGHFLASFFGACIRNALQKGSWRLLGWILAPFSRVWEGSGEDFGGFWEGLEVPKLQCSWTAFFDFVFWLLVLLEGFGSKTGCLKIA